MRVPLSVLDQLNQRLSWRCGFGYVDDVEAEVRVVVGFMGPRLGKAGRAERLKLNPFRTLLEVSKKAVRIYARFDFGRLEAARVGLVTILAVAATAVIFGVVWSGFSMRPIADDYDHGVAAGLGLFGALEFWWLSWSGSLTTIFLQVLLVGLPLLHLPWTYASFVPFLTSSLLVTGLLTWIVVRSLPRTFSQPRLRPLFLIFFLVVIVMWWGFWWISTVTTSLSPGDNPWPRGLAFWQTVNVGYVIVVTLMVWIWLALRTSLRKRNPAIVLVLSSVAGLLVGFMGPVFALSAAIFVALFIVRCYFSDSNGDKPGYLAMGGGLFFLAAAALLDNLSPGSNRRSESLADPTAREVLVGIIQIPGQVAVDLQRAFSDVGTMVSFVALIGLTLGLGLVRDSVSVRTLLSTGGGILLFSLILATCSRLGQLFSYDAWWHLMGLKTLVWLGTSCVAVAFGGYLQSRLGQVSGLSQIGLVVAIVGLALSGSSLGQLAFEVQSREKAWHSGPAAVWGIADIDEDWVNSAWVELNESRKEPTSREVP